MLTASLDDFEFEADSMTSQFWLTARTCLMEKFVVVGTKSKTDNTPEQIDKWLTEYVLSLQQARSESCVFETGLDLPQGRVGATIIFTQSIEYLRSEIQRLDPIKRRV